MRVVFDNSGNTLADIDYDAFGGILSGIPVDRYAYTGREWDDALGLQYSRARMYDPSIGRWTSEDPIGFDALDPNLQRYVGNGPTNGVDPSGMDELVVEGNKVYFTRYYYFNLFRTGGKYYLGTIDDVDANAVYVRRQQYKVHIEFLRNAVERDFTVGYGGEWREDPGKVLKCLRPIM